MNSKRQKSCRKGTSQKEKNVLMPLGEFFDQHFGAVGTPKRDALDKEYAEFEKRLICTQVRKKQTA